MADGHAAARWKGAQPRPGEAECRRVRGRVAATVLDVARGYTLTYYTGLLSSSHMTHESRVR